MSSDEHHEQPRSYQLQTSYAAAYPGSARPSSAHQDSACSGFARGGSAEQASVLSRFNPQVATWFAEVFAEPTAVQKAAWEKISLGGNTLIVAPTGSGKTLAAFLWAINGLSVASGQTVAFPAPKNKPLAGKERNQGVKVLYISPLKALGVDVENNLRAPLTGINHVAARLGLEYSDISVAVRSGDTPAAERARQVRKPPDILITTPESAYLMLTSKAGAILKNVETVIVDEIHAVAGTKRGAHLSLTLERLERLAGRTIQRVGLSATARPIDAVAHFLAGDRPVDIVNPRIDKQWELSVRVPVADMSDGTTTRSDSTAGEATYNGAHNLGSALSDLPDTELLSESALPTQGSIWPFIEERVYHDVMTHRSTLIFVNSRRTAERLTSRLNEIYAEEHDPESLSPQLRRTPAQLMKASDVAGLAPTVIARAHHGSVSKDERAETERMLKEGSLRAVVATSSLELGIDMGAVELVVQVESPPSVASGLQRVGRAGHMVGALSKGVFYPKHRADLIQTAVVVGRMDEGAIEELKVPRNALDVLLQQTVAAVSVEDLDVEEWYATVVRAYPYRDLSRSVFDAVIDLASGVYPSTDFAELRPRVVFDRITGRLTARPGAQRVAVTSGGTIPDRGMFSVFLAGQTGTGSVPRRVGELDEEMVYESRVGDVFTLGASSWRIEEITRDQVLVIPAPGHTGRLPFWTGDQVGRPAELGKALGAFRRRTLARCQSLEDNAKENHGGDLLELEELGLDAFARQNLVQFLHDQQESTGIVPDEKTLVLERFHDELGDWRIVLHTPYGRGVNAAWALAVGARISERTGIDAQAVASDDGIVLRLPESDEEPGADLFMIDPDDIEALVADQVGNSALFASRFRECAARALLLPRRDPGKRAPLWQQRQRAAQLLDVARKYPSFPIILETIRECLQDVYDLPALVELLQEIKQRRIRIAEVVTSQPSPFAASILFSYTGAFMYEGDSPLAEKRAAALSLDPALLASLLGTVELRDLLDPEIIAEVHDTMQRKAPHRRAKTTEELVDALRVLGPVPLSDLPAITEPPMNREQVMAQLRGRVMEVRIAGVAHLAQTLDAPLLRDALGIPIPPGVAAQVETITDALEQLVSRWVRVRGPFTPMDVQHSFGLAAGIAHGVVEKLCAQSKLVAGRFRQDSDVQEYVATEVLKIIRARSLAAVREQTQPVSHAAFGRFLPEWQHVASVGEPPELAGPDGVFNVVEQLAGVRLPASAWETLVLPQRVRNYSPLDLDELTNNGEVIVVGAGRAGAHDPWVMLLPTDYAAELIPHVDIETLSETQQKIMAVLSHGGGFLFSDIYRESVSERGTSPEQSFVPELGSALWDLFEAGLVSPDGFAPIRARLAAHSGTKTAHRTSRRPNRSRIRMGRTSFAHSHRVAQPPDVIGRWATTVAAEDNATARSVAHGEAWLDRYGVVTRGAVVSEDVVGGFALAYKVLSGFEESGKALRGYLIEGLGAAQFSTSAVIDRLRGLADTPDIAGWPSGASSPRVYVLAAADPANPYGAALPWPEPGPTRAAGAVVVLIDGLLAAHLTRGGRNLTLFSPPTGVEQQEFLGIVLGALAESVLTGKIQPLIVEKINGVAVLRSPELEMLRILGVGITPRGARISGDLSNQGQARRGRSLSSALDSLPSLESAPGSGQHKKPPHRGFRSGGYR
ncbi:ATP-dependent helicase [Corynebacterium pseudotuberculosis]|uniref:ATP-dependent helicase n=1 Tax=Corynebacterium pseudotuberculosis TaxID=1719 RepID=UPI000947571B|nr:ATP-dependent helicase [Corynebacterium pseudotuberculosis]APQ55833.1 ATP-dependent helicase [Corynebacterium pseudotuberculosis]AUY60072.1 ATP-dependent helicase [Corynebacterium pseudotuberculosis]WAE79494.1 ATP-dependent helicase [Corynebacterium pseudotuberculosis]WAE81543.1 ATP-dependent helicase [Corynebacterium pseudotuberculosis]WAE89744.1 ATP-dependent helicase [Corynebacterium pseudotuberculosis]